MNKMDIKLKQWNLKDRFDLIRICNEVDRSWLRGTIPYPYTEKDAEWYIGMAREREGKDALIRAIVADGEIVGNITLEQKGDIFVPDAELGYLLLPNYAGLGIASEAVAQLCALGFSQLSIRRITAQVCAPHVASCRVLEKNGFTLEGRMRDAVYVNRQLCDLLIYGKLK